MLASSRYILPEESITQQTLKLVNLISSLKTETEENAPFMNDLNNLLNENKLNEAYTRIVAETDLIFNKQEKDLESIFNLLIALICKSENKQILVNLANEIVKTEAGKPQRKMAILNNIYANLEVNDVLRYDIYIAIINYSAKNDYMNIIITHMVHLDLWMKTWGVDVEQKRNLFMVLRDALIKTGYSMEAYECVFKYLFTFENADDNSLNSIKDKAREAIKEAISNEDIFNFEELLRLRAIQNINSEKCFDFAKVFLSGDVNSYREFVKNNSNIFNELSLNEEDCIKKIRMLTLVTVVGGTVPGKVEYNVIQKALDIPEDDVELWILEVVRAGLIDAKMNQLEKIVIVNRATPRQFSENEWKKLDTRIDAWKNNLKEVLKVIGNAKLIAQSH